MSLYVESLHIYPLTGARGAEVDNVFVARGGFRGDREHLLYTQNSEGEHVRVGSKDVPQLMKLELQQTMWEDWRVIDPDTKQAAVLPHQSASGTQVEVKEFDKDTVQCLDKGEVLAKFFSEYLNRQNAKVTDVRHAQKTTYWMEGGADNSVLDRANAPVHIMTRPTVRHIGKLAAEVGITIADEEDLARRFRPNIILDGDIEAYTEQTWMNRILHIAGVDLLITRPTGRCVVPGFDANSGENMRDIPKLFPQLPKRDIGGKMKTVCGVYAVPIIENRKQELPISAQEQVTLS